MKRFIRVMPVMVLFAAMLAGCASVVRQPEIRLVGVSVGGLGLRGGTVVAEIEITNPNSFDIETRSISYDLKLTQTDTSKGEWMDFAKGEYTKTFKVRENDTATLEIPIEFSYSSMGGAMRSIMDRGTFNYSVEGRVRLREPLSREIPYRHRGNVSLAGIR